MRRIAVPFAALSIAAVFCSCLAGDEADTVSPTPTLAPSAAPTLAPAQLSQVIGDAFSGVQFLATSSIDDGIDPCSLARASPAARSLSGGLVFGYPLRFVSVTSKSLGDGRVAAIEERERNAGGYLQIRERIHRCS